MNLILSKKSPDYVRHFRVTEPVATSIASSRYLVYIKTPKYPTGRQQDDLTRQNCVSLRAIRRKADRKLLVSETIVSPEH